MALDTLPGADGYLNLDINDRAGGIQPIAHALASNVRLNILRALGRESMNINELSERLNVPASTVSLNVSVLERAGLVLASSQSGVRGTMRLCSLRLERVSINLLARELPRGCAESVEMPLGAYSLADGIAPPCGLANAERVVDSADSPMAFYSPERLTARAIWFRRGRLEYMMPAPRLRGGALSAMEISFEAGALPERDEVRTAIALEINGRPAGAARVDANADLRVGALNPPWWSARRMQYGRLLRWRIDKSGCRIDGERVNDTDISCLRLTDGDYFTLRISVFEDDASGGVCLYGRGFGDSPQDIALEYECE